MAPLSLRRFLSPMADVALAHRASPSSSASLTDTRLEQSLEQCRLLLADRARSFAFATRFLPPPAQVATQALYAFFRTVDDVADDCRFPGDPAALARLDGWQHWVERGCPPEADDPVRYATSWVVRHYDLDRCHLLDLLTGVRGDVTIQPIATVADQEHYCYQVAATVGLTMARVLGVTEAAALRHAAELGIAMQLTNIVRDVGEDVQRSRIYLPAEELAAEGYSAAQLAAQHVNSAFIAVLRRQIARARDYYRRGEAGIVALPAEAQFAIRLAARLYAGILNKVEQRGYDVFTGRAHLSRNDKLRWTLRLLVEQRR